MKQLKYPQANWIIFFIWFWFERHSEAKNAFRKAKIRFSVRMTTFVKGSCCAWCELSAHQHCIVLVKFIGTKKLASRTSIQRINQYHSWILNLMESPRSLIIRFNETEWHAKGVDKKCFCKKKLAMKKLKLRTGLAFCDACHRQKSSKGGRRHNDRSFRSLSAKNHKQSRFADHNCQVTRSHLEMTFCPATPARQTTKIARN